MRYVAIVVGLLLVTAALVGPFTVPLGANCANLTAWDLWRLRDAAQGCTGPRNGMTAAAAVALIAGVALTVSGIVISVRRTRTVAR